MTETNKLCDFFSKLDRSKKKVGFVTVNEVTEKKQQKLDAQIKRTVAQPVEKSEDDEWKPIDEISKTSSAILPFGFEDSAESDSDSQINLLPLSEPVKANTSASNWQNSTTIPQSDPLLAESPPKPKEEESKPKKFRPGIHKKIELEQKSINMEEFPDLLGSTTPKKRERKKNGKTNPPTLNVIK